MKSLWDKLTYANVMATVALFVALGGASYAASELPPDSVGTEQIKDGAITAAKIRNEAITGAQVKDGSLEGGDLGENFPGEGDEAGMAHVIYGTDVDKGKRIYDDVLTIPGALAVTEARNGFSSSGLGSIEVNVPPLGRGTQYSKWVVSRPGDRYRPAAIPPDRMGHQGVIVESKDSTGTSFTARDSTDPKRAAWIKCSFEKISLQGLTRDNEMYCFAVLSPAEAKSIEDERGK
jgi:hypothetical protein